jgi:4-diphosphocytidyl-2-C-methyl-D-erythritol kinase
MNVRQNESLRIVHAPAKLNLSLDVLGRRDDGYHDVATLMVPIRLFDSLSFESLPAAAGGPGRIEFLLRGRDANRDVPADSSNLVVRALELLRARSGCELGARVTLVKRIPSAAGLGGGSSDASAALGIANQSWGIHWDLGQLASLAAELGSDVPFFLTPGAAICRGRGERVERIGAIVPIDVVIVKPAESLSTAAVYRALDGLPDDQRQMPGASETRLAALAGALGRGNLNQLAKWMDNRLEAAAAVLSREMEGIRKAFAELGCLGHQLSGSGSAYFGICRHAQEARRLATALESRQLGHVYVTRSGS